MEPCGDSLTSGNHCFRGIGSGSGRMEYISGKSCGKSGLWNVAAISGNREHIREAAGWYVDSGSTVKTGDCRVLSGDFSAGFSGKTAYKKRKTVENPENISGNGTMQYVTSAFTDGTSLAAERKVTFLDVGQGDASLLQSGGQTLCLTGEVPVRKMWELM